MLKKTLLVIASASIFAGCQGHSNLISESALSTTSLEILASESQKALIAQQSLKTAQAADLEIKQKKQARFNVDIINANYIGAPEVILNSVANTYGYRYLEAGPTKTLPIVNFTNRKVTAFELVKDIAVFVDAQATITVDHQNKSIILTYK